MKTIYSLLLVILTCEVYAQQWTQIDDFPGLQRDDGLCFTIGDYSYCGTGMDIGFQYTNDFYAFNSITESWSTIASLPDTAKLQYGTSFVYNGEGYVFGGIGQSGYRNGLWKYTPGTDTWSYVSTMPAKGRCGAMAYVVGDTAYVAGGRTNTSLAVNDVWGYDLSNGSWSVKSELPGSGVFKGAAGVYQTNTWAGIGANDFDETNIVMYKGMAELDSWLPIGLAAFQPRSYVSYAQNMDQLFVFGGIDSLGVFSNKFERLNLDNSSYDILLSFPGEPRRGCASFIHGDKFYVTTGLSESMNRLSETWVAAGVIGLKETEIASIGYFIQDGRLYFESQSEIKKIEIISSIGKVIYTKENAQNINISALSQGVYLYRVFVDNKLITGRVFLR